MSQLVKISPARVGLFGTCGGSRWREPFVAKLQSQDVPFFNPQLPHGEWQPSLANEYIQKELHYLEHCPVVIFAVTAETPGLVSLMEIGFAVAQLLENKSQSKEQQLFVYVDPECGFDTALAKESAKVRQLLLIKLKKAERSLKTLFVAHSLDELLNLVSAHPQIV